MAGYLGSTLHVDRPLSNFALAYENHELIGDKLSPIALVPNKSDSYFIRSKANGVRVQTDNKIGLLDSPPEVENAVTTANFSCQSYGWMAKTAIESEKAADVPLSVRQDAAMDAAAQCALSREVRLASLFTTSGNYASGNVQTLSGASQWLASGGAGDPFGVIETGLEAIWPAPNTRLVAWMGQAVWREIKNHPAFLDRVKYTGTNASPGRGMLQAFAEAIEVDEIYVGKAWQIATNPGQTDSATRVWGKYFGIARIPKFPSTRAMGFSQTFRWQETGPGGVAIASWFEPGPGLLGVNRYKMVHADHEVALASDAAMLVVNAVA